LGVIYWAVVFCRSKEAVMDIRFFWGYFVLSLFLSLGLAKIKGVLAYWVVANCGDMLVMLFLLLVSLVLY
jgi:hypothetical protein